MPPIIEELKGKKIAILGFGREGKSTYHYIRKYLQVELTIADAVDIDTTNLCNVKTQCGPTYQDLQGFDIIFKSPGIVLEKEDQLAAMDSQTNMFLKHYGKQTIGITGTKGKSTTSSLLYHILKENDKDVHFLGNIGIPAFDALPDIQEHSIIVFELSCHQLEYVHYNPHIAVLLNIFEEHLDHYGTFEKYVHAKENVWRYQNNEDILVCEKTLIQEEMKAKTISVSMQERTSNLYANIHDISLYGEQVHIDTDVSPLIGHHNMYDIVIDFFIAHMFQISYEKSLQALHSYQPLPHRLQNIGIYHEIKWYDDSISTICETTIQALQTLPETETLLLGGMDRGIDYTPLAQYLQEHRVKNIILMYDSGKVMQSLLDNCIYVKDLQEAVQVAKEVTSPGKTVLLSPAAASYGFFKNFEDRGNCFQAYIKDER